MTFLISLPMLLNTIYKNETFTGSNNNNKMNAYVNATDARPCNRNIAKTLTNIRE